METLHYLGLAYLLIWTLLGVFGYTIFSKQNRINKEIEDLKEAIKKKTGDSIDQPVIGKIAAKRDSRKIPIKKTRRKAK